MFGLGLPEILLIVVVAFLLFGVKRLPELGRSIGETIASFKKGLREGDRDPESPAKNADADKKP